MVPMDREGVYRALMPFYMWPASHGECARNILALLILEGKVRGTSFRRKLLVENDLGLKLKHTK